MQIDSRCRCHLFQSIIHVALDMVTQSAAVPPVLAVQHRDSAVPETFSVVQVAKAVVPVPVRVVAQQLVLIQHARQIQERTGGRE